MADTSIWVDHLRSADTLLSELLKTSQLAMHPFVLGEISLGHLSDRQETLLTLSELPKMIVADEAEVARLIEAELLSGTGVGYVDVHLLASTRLTHDAKLWTRDRRLRSVAERLRVAAHMTH